MRKKLSKVTSLLTICAVLCLSPLVILAQGVRGTIKGTITDTSGAVIAGATVKLTDISKQQIIRTLQTDQNGIYHFVEVEPANYSISIAANGFTESKILDITVEPNRNLTINKVLSVGGATEEVSVTASQELIDRESAALGTTVDNRRIVDMPLNGRNVLQLATLQPGVGDYQNPVSGNPAGSPLGFRINGSRGVENNIQFEGGNNNEVAVGGMTGVMPKPDAVQEFRILTSNYEAEFGRNSGSVINAVIKSGTNNYHGNARIFWRPTVLSAARYFDKQGPPLRGNDDYRRVYERKEFGGNLGGPISIPSLYNGKNKSFFFIDYEGRRQLIGDTRTIQGLPTQSERIGDFSNLKDSLGKKVYIADPTKTGACKESDKSGCFENNIIPSSRISPIAQYYMGFLPTGNEKGQAGVGANRITNNDQLTTRLDFQLNEKHSLSGTYNYFDEVDSNPFAFGGASVPGFGADNLRTTQNYAIRHTYVISPTLVNSLLVGYSRNRQPGVTPQNTRTPQEIGFTADFVANKNYAGAPFIQLFDRGLTIGNSIQGPQARVSENFQIQNAISWIKGSHRFKFGFDGTKYKQDQTFLFVNQGILTFRGTRGIKTTGDDLADFLLGVYPFSQQYGSNGERDFRQDFVSGFVQDTWSLKNNLTLSYGVRYEYVSPLIDKFDRVTYYRPGTTSQRLINGEIKTHDGKTVVIQKGKNAPNGLVYVGDPDPVLGGTVPRGGIAKDLNNFAPRLGVAYSPSIDSGIIGKLLGGNQTVIRAGFGMFYGALIADTALQQLTAPGFNSTDALFENGGGTLSNPFAGDVYPNFKGKPLTELATNPFGQNSVEIRVPLTQFSRATDPRIRTPYTAQYNLTIERGFAKNYVATISYIGNRGIKLFALEALNPGLGGLLGTPDPTANTNNVRDRRLNRDFRGGITHMVSAGNSHYHALQAQLQKRMSYGLLLQAAYTFSKSITDSDQLRSQLDLLDRRKGRGLSNEDIPHRFVTSFVYDLPFARNSNGFVKRLAGGWSLGGILAFQSGTPFSVNNIFETVGTDSGIISFADLGESFKLVDPRKNNDRAFNSDAFKTLGNKDQYTDLRRGTSGFNQFRLKNGINNLDFILSKKTSLYGDSAKLELRFEAFNAFNHAQFQNADLNLNNLSRGTFGKYTSTREARILQLAARLSF